MPSLTYRTLANFRTSTTATVGAVYYLCDQGKEGMFRCIGKTTREDDGALFLLGKNRMGYERILEHDVVCLNWFGLIPDDPDAADHNTAITDAAIRSLNYCTLLVRKVNGQPCTFHWNHLRGSGIFSDQEEACISFEDKVMVFEFELGVKGMAENGYAAVQAYPRYGTSYHIQKRVSFSHKGSGMDSQEGAQRDEKGNLVVDAQGRLVYTQDWGSYKTPGLRLWTGGELHGTNYYGFPGFGGSVFGQIGVKAPEVFREFVGTVNYWNGDLFLKPDKAEDLDAMVVGTTVEIEGQPSARKVGWRREDNTLHLSYGTPESTGLKLGAKVRGRYARQTKDFFADFVQCYPLDGLCNFDGNGAGGLFIVGAEANHGNFQAVSCRDNGGWGIVDWSFLGCHHFVRHCTTNGKRYNFDGNRVVGGITTGWNPNTATSDIAAYDEEGQGPNQIWGNTTVLGGFNRNGVVGGGGVLQNNRLQGFAQLENLGRLEGKANLTLSRMARAVDELTTTPTLAEARAAYVAQNLLALPLAA